ncbi:MAG: isoprenylcysteine carboxylmethyltransferase family protein [Ruminococcaceae bacterium]|nr:isoprenylcysteine carboxylmethyltransferase family protein [Oscillospiraceae bacterium]
MTKKLFIEASLKFSLGMICVGLLIFAPAGTLRFWNGWLLMCVLFVPMFFAGLVLMAKNPELLQKRLNAKEKQKAQDTVVKLSGLMFIVGFVAAGFSYRFDFGMLPTGISIGAAAVFLLAYLLFAEVLRENTYLSRTIEVQENQTVVDTGLYGIVRHPMYSATLLLFLTMPLILGSLFSFFVFLAYPFLIAARIKHEERLLEKELDGYRAYQKKVRFKLIPFVW